MFNRLARLRTQRARGDHGFTLIELLVVVVIIGVLIAVAIPLYLNYRRGANDKAAQSDLRNAINVLEQCNTDNLAYPSDLAPAGGEPTGCTGQNVNLSSNSTLKYYSADPYTSYVLFTTNSGGAKWYCYSSSAGGAVAAVPVETYTTGTTC